MTAGSGNFELDGMVIRLNLRAVAFFAFPYTEKTDSAQVSKKFSHK